MPKIILKKPPLTDFRFTPQQLNIAKSLATGLSRKSMAADHGIAIGTLDAHLKIIRQKMKLDSVFKCGCVLATYF